LVIHRTSLPTHRGLFSAATDCQFIAAESAAMGYGIQMQISDQLELLGLEEARRIAVAGGATKAEKNRIARRVEMTHEMLSALPTPGAIV